MEIKKKKAFDADVEADSLLELQMNLKEKSKVANVLTAALCFGFIFVFAVLFWVLPDNDFSAGENRSLQKFPDFSRESFFSGEFTSDFADYMADQFPARDFFVGVKAAFETVQFKSQNNDTFIADDGYLVARADYPDEEVLEKNLTAAAKFQAACEKAGINCVAAFAGRKQDVLPELLPSVYGSYYQNKIWAALDSIADENSLEYVNLRDTLAALDSDNLYYKSDHHWTTTGAFEAYKALIGEFGEEAYTDFDIEIASDSFYGTTWSAAGVKWAPADTIEYYRFDGDEEYTMQIIDKAHTFEGVDGCEYVTDENGVDYATFDGFYVRKFLSEKDKYASFIGGNFGYTKITKNTDEERETLLVVKDSFSHSMVSFLARHYDLILVDLRYYSQSMIELCETEGIENVLMLYNMETLCEGNYLKWLVRGIK